MYFHFTFLHINLMDYFDYIHQINNHFINFINLLDPILVNYLHLIFTKVLNHIESHFFESKDLSIVLCNQFLHYFKEPLMMPKNLKMIYFEIAMNFPFDY
jgi:hypothetical protein